MAVPFRKKQFRFRILAYKFIVKSSNPISRQNLIGNYIVT